MIISDLHAVNPYENFNHAQNPASVIGWNSDAPVFKQLIDGEMPKLIIEVGSWLGASAIHMAGCLGAAGLPDTKIVCVDTWLGSLDFWTDQLDEQRYKALGLVHGYPTVYYNFLANVVRAGFQNTIIPFPQTSTIAAKWFNGRHADMIYLDASHEYDDVVADLNAWWPILRGGGVLFGDDYTNWTGVKGAVEWWASGDRQVTVEPSGHWWVRK